MTTNIAVSLGMSVGLPAIVLHADRKIVNIVTAAGVLRAIPVHNWMALVMQMQAISPEFH